jgi:phosphomevalonate kinase
MFRSSASLIRRSLISTTNHRSYVVNLSGKTFPIRNIQFQQIRWSSTDPNAETVKAAEGETVKETVIEDIQPEVDDLGDVIPPSGDAEKIATLERQVKDLRDRVIRSMAEEENVRKIARRDVDNARAYAVTGELDYVRIILNPNT